MLLARYGGVEPSDSVVASVEGASVLFIPLGNVADDDGARRHDMATVMWAVGDGKN